MSQKIKTSVEIDGSLTASQIANATTDTDKFLVSDGGVVKYRTGAEMLSDLGVSTGTANRIQHPVKAGVSIFKGQAVYVTDADGTNMIVELASNLTEATSSKTMGLVTSNVAANGFTDVVTEGILSGLNTSSATAGDPVWLGTNGNLRFGLSTKPSAPSHLVFIGIVTRANANNGEIFVKVQNGFELNEIHDVDLKTNIPVNGEILGFNGTLWVNKTIAGWLGYTPQAQLNGTGFVKASGTTITYDNTSYYPASNPNGYISTYTETDTLASVTARGAMTSGDIYTPNNGGIFFNGNGVYGSGIFGRNFGQDLGFNAGGLERLSIASNGAITASISFRSPIIYDSNDTAYFIDLNNSGKSGKYAGYLETYYSANKAVLVGNWNGANYWGFGSNGTHTMQIDMVGADSSTFLGASDINLKLGTNTVWHTGNDGSGSGLDADLLDGQQATSFAKQAYVNVGYDFNTLAAENSDSGIVYRLESSVANPPNGSIYNWSLWQQGNSTRGSQIAVGAYGGNEIYFRGANADTGSYRGWQRVLHDGNYSSYAVPTSRTITINGTSYDLSANRSWTITATETDTLATVTARGNTTTGDININGKIRVGSFPNSTTNNGEAWLGRAADRSAGTMTVQLGGNLDRKFEVVDYGWTTVNFSVNGYGAAEASGSMRAPIFYDSNNTGYYIDGASTSNLAALYTYSYQGNGNVGGTGSASWHPSGIYCGSTMWQYGDMYKNNSSIYDIYNGFANSSLRAPVFYDNNDTAYYLDPANADVSAVLRGTVTIGGGTGGNYDEGLRIIDSGSFSVIAFGASGNAGAGRFNLLKNSSDVFELRNVNGSQIWWANQNGDVGTNYISYAGSSSRAPIFYDSNNTGYYVDPAAGSALDTANVRLLTFRGVGGDSGNGSVGDMYGIYQQGGAWNYPFPDLCIGYHTGIKIGAYYSYNGTRFYNNSDWATITASVNDGDNNFRGYYDVIAYASDRRLKHKVKPIEDALSKVKSLTGMTYQWNEIGKGHGWDPDTEVREAGVFAQDVQAVLPEAVRLAPFDDEHGVSRSGENFLTVKYDKIVPLLIEAIKEQQTQIEELKELINKLISK